MRITSPSFKENARGALADANLRQAMDKLANGFPMARLAAISELPEFEALRDRGREIKDHVLANLDIYLERFEAKCVERGGQVHWCRTAEDARNVVLDICKRVGAKTVTKGKTMIGEEIALNQFLEAHGVVPVETDLGEYIVQLADEPPSHIIAPAIHKTKEQVSDLFVEHHRQYGKTARLTEGAEMVHEAREVLRPKFLAADVGVTGANFLIAETGSTVIVTNEGNGDLTQMLPRVHIVMASLEKVVPTLEDASTILRLLARSATGQEMSVYTTFSTGPKRPGDLDGPDEFHVVLLDGGRSSLLGSEFGEMLRCIRCGACMNHCPVYNAIGGHAYGWVYPGPIGSVLTPALQGLEGTRHLPNASTLCGKCESVCPMRIPLPKLLRQWREKAHDAALPPFAERAGLGLWAFFAKRPWLYRLATGFAIAVLGAFGRQNGRFASLPLASSWTDVRDMPAPEGKTFHALWSERQK